MTEAHFTAHRVNPNGHFELWHADLEAASRALEVLERQTPCLSQEQIERAAALAARPTDQQNWRAAHIALKVLIARWGGLDLARAPYTFSSMGRPAIKGAPFSFSLSHSGGHALIGLTAHGPIGVDLEVPRHVKIADDRRRQIEAHGQSLLPEVVLSADPDSRFLQAWVRIEAVAKAEGIGVGRALTNAGIMGDRSSRPASAAHRTFEVRDLDAGDHVFAAVAAPKLPAILGLKALPCTESGLQALVKHDWG